MRNNFIDLTQTKLNILIGATILIGAAGGIYLLRKKKPSQIAEKKQKNKNSEICNVCVEQVEPKDIRSCATCFNCGKYVCRGRNCSVWFPKPGGWECQLCNLSSASHRRASEWVNKEFTQESNFTKPSMSVKSEIFIPIRPSSNLSDYESISQPASYIDNNKEKIRERVEEILADMLGGPLDDVSVAQLSKHKKYLSLFHKYHLHLSEKLFLLENSLQFSSNDLPLQQTGDNQQQENNGSHVQLKSLIEKIIQESLNLSTLFDFNNKKDEKTEKNVSLPYFDAKQYQELLATAVLNKIVDSNSYQNQFEKRSSISSSKRDHAIKNKTGRTSSSSSPEPISDENFEDPIEPNIFTNDLNGHIDTESILSDYLASHTVPLPTFTNSDSEEFDLAGSNDADGTWEDNWLFKKRKVGSSSSSVGMLVPAPKEDIRTLIGDKTADEVSDLSEADSDFEDIDEDPDLFTQNGRIRSNLDIGGKNGAGLFDELVEHSSLISKTSSDGNEPIIVETLNENVIEADPFRKKTNFPNERDLSEMPYIGEEAINTAVTTGVNNGSLSSSSQISHNNQYNSTDENDETETKEGTSYFCSNPKHNVCQTNKTNLKSIRSVNNTFKNNNDIDVESPTQLSMENVDESSPAGASYSYYPSHNVCQTNKTNLKSIRNVNNTFKNTNDIHVESPTQLSMEDVDDSLKYLTPGSIAERERKKWYNAVEMPNNPYTPDALRKRLSDGHNKPFDITDSVLTQRKKEEEQLPNSSSVNEEEQPDFGRYCRDYYVHETLQSPKKQMNELKIFQPYDEGNDNLRNGHEEIKEQVKISTPILPLNLSEINYEEIPLKIESLLNNDSNETSLSYRSIEEFKSFETNPDLNNNSNSLTTSEDSDIVRIYDLNTKQERKIKNKPEKINEELNNTLENLLNDHDLESSEKTVEPITPASFRSWQPKRKIIDPSQILSPDQEQSCAINNLSKKYIMDEYFKKTLPSVKELAKTFSTSPEKSRPERPKTLPLKISKNNTSGNNIFNNIINLDKISSQNGSPKNENFLVAERPLSPVAVVTPGKLKNNIAFFENLKKS